MLSASATVDVLDAAPRRSCQARIYTDAAEESLRVEYEGRRYALKRVANDPPPLLYALASAFIRESPGGPANVALDIRDIVPCTRSERLVRITFDARWSAGDVTNANSHVAEVFALVA